MISSALTPMNPSEALFTTTQNDGAFQSFAYSRSTNSRITLNNGEIFINGTHAADTASVRMVNGAVVLAELVGIEIRDFSIIDVDSIKFYGRKGNDQFNNFTTIAAKVYGHEGNDTLRGGSGNDYIAAGFGDDVVYGELGDDRIFGGAGDDRLFGRSGNDFIYGANGADRIYGGSGDDMVTGDAGDDRVYGGAGNDSVHGWTGNDRLWGDAGNDHIYGAGGDDILTGGDGADKLYGGHNDDQIFGSGGADLLNGGNGNDTLSGDSGDDQLFGSLGDDRLRGGTGADVLVGGAGMDLLDGSAGRDQLNGGSGRDVLLPGNDSVQDKLFGNGGVDSILYFAGDKLDGDAADLKIKFRNKTSYWTTNELLVISEAMEQLYQATGNNRLLTDKIVGKDVTLDKYSSLQGGAAAINYMTINTVNGVSTYDRVIKFANWDETNELLNPGRKLAFLHELAHNFDNQFEFTATPGITWNRMEIFRSRSGWTQTNPNSSAYAKSGDGQWWYKKSSQFHRSYGKISPYEDWATMWELYFHPTAEPPAPGSNLNAKLNVIKSFMQALS